MKSIWVMSVLAVLIIAVAPVMGVTVVKIDPASQEVYVGENFTVNVTVEPDTDIAGVQFNLNFDPNILEAVSVTEGNLLKQGGSTYFSSGNINNSNGVIGNVYGAIITPGGSVNTSGAFAVITFRAVSEGTSYLNLTNVVVGDPDASPVDIQVINGTVTVTRNITTNITAIQVNVIPKEVYWGVLNKVTVNVTTPSGYPVVNATVSIIGAQTNHTYAEDVTGPNGTVVFTIRPSPLDEGKGGLIVYANYTYDNKTITNQTTIDVIAPANITYIYATARIEGTTNVLANKRIEVTYRVDNITAPLNYYGVLPNNTTDRGEFLLKFPTPNIGEQHDYYIYLTPVPSTEQKGKYVNVEYHTVIPGYVRITYGTTSVQANVPIRATVYVLYPNNTVVQVFDDLTNTWSQHRSLDTTPKRADGVSKFKVKMQVMLGDKPYDLTDLEQALSYLGIDMTLPKSVYVCINDTNIAVMDSNGQACDYIPLNLDNSTAIFYVRSNAPTDPSELRPGNTGIINITGWYNYTTIPGTQPMNKVVNLTDYDYADFEGTGYIAGEVLDGETMHSIAGATVYVKWFNGTTWVNATDFEGKLISTTTDEYGHYKLEVISGGPYKVYAKKEGYVGCAPSANVSVRLGETVMADVVLIREPTQGFKIGDVSGDGQITVVDAMFIAQYVAGVKGELPNPAAADVNCDGQITVVDAMFIAQYVAGIRPSLGC